MKITFTLKLILLIVCLLTLHAECKELKIGLTTTCKDITISANENFELINLHNNKLISKIKNNDPYIVRGTKGLISIIDKKLNTKLGSFTGPIKVFVDNDKSFVQCNNNWYRGGLTIIANKNNCEITIVNNIELEDYLSSVVPSEIPYTWHKEALKAQSVAARSYTIGYLGRRKDKGYDLESTIEDQVYLGVKSEKYSTTQAVNETRRKILIDNTNKPLIALYHSSGGGYTDSIENLWDIKEIKPSAHIQPRPDYDDNSPYFKWYRSYKLRDLNNILSDLNIGEIKDINILSKSISTRITQLKLIGTKSEITLRGEEFRRRIKLPSSKFNYKIKNDQITFAGRGNGHGLGLSQWGAKALAEYGFNHGQILSHYYPGARLAKLAKD